MMDAAHAAPPPLFRSKRTTTACEYHRPLLFNYRASDYPTDELVRS